MKNEISIEGHGTPFTLVRCPHGFSFDSICQEIVDNNLRANEIEKKYPSLKATDFDRSDKDFVFIIKSKNELTSYEINYIEKSLTESGRDYDHFCLVIGNCYTLNRVPKVLIPFM